MPHIFVASRCSIRLGSPKSESGLIDFSEYLGMIVVAHQNKELFISSKLASYELAA